VLAGLEVVRTLNDRGVRTEAPIEVAFWTNEEGSRFVPVMMGSGVFCGAFSLETAYAARDVDGKSVGEELRRHRLPGDQVPGDHPIGAYFEAHIEQGPVLEDADKVIGVVPAVMGLSWYDCTVTGMEAHAGPTPMHLRRDALQVATTIMQETVAIANRYPPYGRGTVGMVQVFPNSRNVIPGQVKFSIDLRNVNDELLNTMHEEMTAFVERTRRETGLGHRPAARVLLPALPVPPGLRGRRARGDGKAGLFDDGRGVRRRPRCDLRRAPGARRHDLRALQGRHQPQRDRGRPAGHLEAGCNVLLHAMLERAGVVATSAADEFVAQK
jgi:N-carbamoyl-L-amino-acid hydrolase